MVSLLEERGVRMEILRYNEETDRYNDLHCGNRFKIKVNDKWKNVRIEMNTNDKWYLIDEDGFICYCSKLEGAEIEL